MRVGQQVIAQHLLSKRWDLRGEIIENRDNGRSYLVQINGRQYLRNRRFLRPLPKPQQQLVSHERQPMATNIQPTRDYNVRVQNQPPHHIPTPDRAQTQAPQARQNPRKTPITRTEHNTHQNLPAANKTTTDTLPGHDPTTQEKKLPTHMLEFLKHLFYQLIDYKKLEGEMTQSDIIRYRLTPTI